MTKLLIFCVLLGATEPTDTEADARSVVNALAEGRFAEVHKRFDETMHAALPSEKLELVWQQLEAGFGEFQFIVDVTISQGGGYTIAQVAGQFERRTLEIKLTYDEKARIAGLFFKPIQLYARPSYVAPDAFDKAAATVGRFKLPGTVCVPKAEGRLPGIVLVHGSGPNDRDETLGANKPFKDIAEGLASRGIVVLRYDKRTLVLGAKAVADPAAFTVEDETIEDAVSAFQLLCAHERVDAKRVFVAGHSLGGMLGPRIAAKCESIAGLIMLAANSRSLEALLLEQVTYLAKLDGTVDAQEQQQIEQCEKLAEQVRSPKLTKDDSVHFGGQKIPGSYWLDLRHYDPPAAAEAFGAPILFLQGGKDYQVTAADFEGWKKQLGDRQDVQFEWFDTLNHLLMKEDGTPSPQGVLKPGNVDEQVIHTMAEWINGS